jgi:Ca2+-binding RTX toxin-like protein
VGRLAFVLGLALLFVLVVAGVAYAATIKGDANDNYLKETCKGDSMYGRAGDDVLDANNCVKDTDVLYAGRGSDWLLANDGDARDVLNGGKGFDTCVVDSREAQSGQASGCNRVLVR